jgi:hypothetical protein
MFYVEQERKRAEKKGWSKRLLACRLCKAEEMRRAASAKRQYLDTYKALAGCADCGLRNPLHPEIYDFDHLPGSGKEFNVSQMLTKSWKRLLMEIEKCEVVCSNCHRIRTRARMRS